eukprot:9480513-Alexandrium_andersonii.AAC.1
MSRSAAPIRSQTTFVPSASHQTGERDGRSCSADTPFTLVAWPGTVTLGGMLASAPAAAAP